MLVPQHLRILAVALPELAAAPFLPWFLSIPLGALGTMTLAIGIAVWLRRPGLLGKRPDGHFPLWSFALFGPWHLVTRLIAHAIRRSGEDHHISEVTPGLLVGGWPHRADQFDAWPAVLDLTAELPRRGSQTYRCIPIWDHTEPSIDQLNDALEWIAAQDGPVLIHCAHGRGRSATVAVAALVARGAVSTWTEALTLLVEARPTTRLTREQRRVLERWRPTRR